MRKSSGNSGANFPEYAVRREIICGYFHPNINMTSAGRFSKSSPAVPFKNVVQARFVRVVIKEGFENGSVLGVAEFEPWFK